VYRNNPTHIDAFFHKGIELAEIGKHEKAIDIFDQILSKHKDNVNIIYAKSRSKASLGMFPESLELLKQAISKNPKTIRAWAKEEKAFTQLHTNDRFRALVKI
jgi:tetratricopeptide (TPR) repeat protein